MSSEIKIQLEINGKVIYEKNIQSNRIKQYEKEIKNRFRWLMRDSDWGVFIIRESKMNYIKFYSK